MVKAGDTVKWRCPMDADYSYGIILDLKKNTALIKGMGYYAGIIVEVNLKNIEKLERGGRSFGSNSKKHSKRSTS